MCRVLALPVSDKGAPSPERCMLFRQAGPARAMLTRYGTRTTAICLNGRILALFKPYRYLTCDLKQGSEAHAGRHERAPLQAEYVEAHRDGARDDRENHHEHEPDDRHPRRRTS